MRAIKPANYAENTAPSIDQAAVEEASRAGKVGVIIQLRTPYVGGKTTTASNKAQRATYEAMLANFLSPYKMLREIQLYPDVGAAGIVISSDDFKRMISSGDRRLQGIVGNKPQYKLSLAKSTLAMNLPPYWGAGATASDQTIAILDSGILKTHAMLQNAGGGSKVTTESCYQSDTTWDNQPYVSACINKQSTGVGDSPAGTPDAGRIFPQTTCQSNFGSGWESYCAHGTHVAAIAAGRPSSAMNPQLSGVAPGAQIASVTITTPGNGLHVFHEDYTKALTDLNNGLTAGSYPYTISMSLGDGLENQPDSLVGNVGPNHTPIAGGTNTFAALVNSLKQKNIPVVAAMGNQGDYFRMNEPASVPGVIKVGSVANNGAPHPTFGTALTIATLSNRVRPEYWPGEYILFAPGGEDQSAGVVSATPYPTGSTTNTMPIAGTSMATPHVAGYYALLKSYYPTYGIDDISTYIQTTFSVGFQIPTGQACGPQPGPSCNSPTSVRFVRLP
ncbi:S8/S53 family peptidase [Acidovorax sp. LjRoot66]|uniref:S8 family peptidase n=1 Tax=Acidovorax sp. LjRoot66 TaxID=3342334 RepID=UPI003ED15CD1